MGIAVMVQCCEAYGRAPPPRALQDSTMAVRPRGGRAIDGLAGLEHGCEAHGREASSIAMVPWALVQSKSVPSHSSTRDKYSHNLGT